MNKSLAIAALLTASALLFAPTANAQKPCGGKKGGVASCGADGRYVCKDGSFSRSKNRCDGSGAPSLSDKATTKAGAKGNKAGGSNSSKSSNTSGVKSQQATNFDGSIFVIQDLREQKSKKVAKRQRAKHYRAKQ